MNKERKIKQLGGRCTTLNTENDHVFEEPRESIEKQMDFFIDKHIESIYILRDSRSPKRQIIGEFSFFLFELHNRINRKKKGIPVH